jgi:hypothetical protein
MISLSFHLLLFSMSFVKSSGTFDKYLIDQMKRMNTNLKPFNDCISLFENFLSSLSKPLVLVIDEIQSFYIDQSFNKFIKYIHENLDQLGMLKVEPILLILFTFFFLFVCFFRLFLVLEHMIQVSLRCFLFNPHRWYLIRNWELIMFVWRKKKYGSCSSIIINIIPTNLNFQKRFQTKSLI